MPIFFKSAVITESNFIYSSNPVASGTACTFAGPQDLLNSVA